MNHHSQKGEEDGVQFARLSKVLEDRSNKLKELSAALESTLASQMTFKVDDGCRKPTDMGSVLHRPGSFPKDQENTPPTALTALTPRRGPSPQRCRTPTTGSSPQRRASPRLAIDPELYAQLPRGLAGLPPSFSPVITAKARQRTSQQPFHVRLYRQAVEKGDRSNGDDPLSARGSQTPQPGKTQTRSRSAEAGCRKSKPKEADDGALLALYKEAFERQERMQIRRSLVAEKAEAERNARKVNKTSEDLVRKRRDKELRNMWETFVASEGNGQEKLDIDLQTINYQQLQRLLGQIGFFSSLNPSSARTEEEEKLTDKMWCAMNTAGMPFVQFRDFMRVMTDLLEPKSPRKVTKSKTPVKPQQSAVSSGSDTPSIAWEVTPIEWDNKFAAETVNAVAAALNLTNAATFAYNPVSRPSIDGGSKDGDSPFQQQDSLLSGLQQRNQSFQKSPLGAGVVPRKALWRQDLSFHKLYKASIGKPPKVHPDPEIEECTFQPAINENSRRLGEAIEEQLMEQTPSGGKISRQDVMSERDRLAKKKLEELRQQKQSKEVEGCTFKPAINSPRPGHRVEKAMPAKPSAGLRPELAAAKVKIDLPFETTEEKEFKEYCTFKPAVKPYDPSKKNGQKLEMIVGFEDHLRRLNQAKQEKLQKQVWEENLRLGRPVHADPAKHDPSEKQTVPKPFHFHLDQRQRSKPLLYMDVDLGSGKSGRLGIHENDEPAVLAKNFATSYQLDDVLCKKLERLLVTHMEQLVPGFKERHQATKDGKKQPQVVAKKAAQMPSGVLMAPHLDRSVISDSLLDLDSETSSEDDEEEG